MQSCLELSNTQHNTCFLKSKVYRPICFMYRVVRSMNKNVYIIFLCFRCTYLTLMSLERSQPKSRKYSPQEMNLSHLIHVSTGILSVILSRWNSLTMLYTSFRLRYLMVLFVSAYCKVGLGICYDVRFAEMAQIYAQKGEAGKCLTSSLN